MIIQYAFENNWNNPAPKAADAHFSGVAKKQPEPKTTDTEPISVIVSKLNRLDHIDAVDVGCGAGRFDILLYRHLGDKLTLTCLDANEDILKNLTTYFNRHGVKTFSSRQSTAEALPFVNDSMDCIFTLNTIDHLDLNRFLNESARVIKKGGYLFVYTRACDKNEENAAARDTAQPDEKQLYSMDTLKQTLDTVEGFSVESIVLFAFNRMALLEQYFLHNRSHKSSTFTPYSPGELEEALKAFSVKIGGENKDMQSIRWFDENVLFIIRKTVA